MVVGGPYEIPLFTSVVPRAAELAAETEHRASLRPIQSTMQNPIQTQHPHAQGDRMTMTTPDENEGVVVNEDLETTVEVAALAAEPVPREMTWAVRLIVGLIAFSAVV